MTAARSGRPAFLVAAMMALALASCSSFRSTCDCSPCGLTPWTATRVGVVVSAAWAATGPANTPPVKARPAIPRMLLRRIVFMVGSVRGSTHPGGCVGTVRRSRGSRGSGSAGRAGCICNDRRPGVIPAGWALGGAPPVAHRVTTPPTRPRFRPRSAAHHSRTGHPALPARPPRRSWSCGAQDVRYPRSARCHKSKIDENGRPLGRGPAVLYGFRVTRPAGRCPRPAPPTARTRRGRRTPGRSARRRSAAARASRRRSSAR